MGIDELVKIHDRSQFEIKLGYLIDHNKKKTDYGINLYFFLPRNLGVNKYNYSNNQFFEDMFSYVRLITPKSDLVNLAKRANRLLHFIEEKKDNAYKHANYINYELKIIICSFRAYLRDYSKAVKKKPDATFNLANLLIEIEHFRDIIKKFSGLVNLTNETKLRDLFLFSDEYSSLVAVMYLFRIYKHINKYGAESEYLQKAIIAEVEYRKHHGMSYASEDDSGNEELLYKYSVFKKYFYNILFLFQKRREDAVEFRHFLYAIAAGIAMIFATSVAFISQKKYGNFTFPFFVALVVSYMFKDRIKDVFRQVFENKFIFKRVYDFKNKIYDPERLELYGLYKERARFIKKPQVPEDIVSTRLYGSRGSLSTWYVGEEVLKYEKKIKINNRKILDSFSDRIEGLNDIMRFNINNFTKKMDDPDTLVYMLNDGVKKVKAAKVYHVNIVIEFTSNDERSLYKIRLILTKDGIKRIEIPKHDIALTNT